MNPLLRAEASWEEAWRRAEIPAAGGHGNARSVARVQSVLAHGGEVLGVPLPLGIGYGLSSPETPIGLNTSTCYWGGWGGSIVVCDLENRLCVSYVMNRMGEGTVGDERGIGILFAAYAALAS